MNSIQIVDFDIDQLRARLRKMLQRIGRAAKYMCSPWAASFRSLTSKDRFILWLDAFSAIPAPS
jgi:hypothetical protein